MAELAFGDHFLVHARVVGRTQIDHDPGVAAAFEAGVVAGDERLVDDDVGGLVTADDHDLGGERELDPGAVAAFPDQARPEAQGVTRRWASGATAGPSLLNSVASLKAMAAR